MTFFLCSEIPFSIGAVANVIGKKVRFKEFIPLLYKLHKGKLTNGLCKIPSISRYFGKILFLSLNLI